MSNAKITDVFGNAITKEDLETLLGEDGAAKNEPAWKKYILPGGGLDTDAIWRDHTAKSIAASAKAQRR